MMKLAVATAIIKNKPRHQTGEEYAQTLCNQFALSELDWKRKYESVESELIRARQELVLREIHGPSQPDSQADVPCNSEPIFPTPPASLEDRPRAAGRILGQTRESELVLHTKFLQGVTHLKTISRQCQGGAQLNSLTKATVTKSIRAIQEAICQPETQSISSKCLLHATETIASVCSAMSETCWTQIGRPVRNLLDTIVKELLRQDALPQNANQENLCEMFLSLALISRLRETGLGVLLGYIEYFSGHLRRVASRIDQLDPVVFENMYFVLGLTDTLVMKTELTNTQFEEAFYQRFSQRLDDSLLHLSDHFPLFAQLVWRIGCRFVSQSHTLQSSQASV